MRLWLGHPIGRFYGGVSVGRYGWWGRPTRVYHTVHVRNQEPASGACLLVVVALAVLALAVEFWPVTLGLLVIAVAATAIHRKHREVNPVAKTAKKEEAPPAKTKFCAVAGCRRLAKWRVTLALLSLGDAQVAEVCDQHLNVFSGSLSLKDRK